jgi:hypothetical protein
MFTVDKNAEIQFFNSHRLSTCSLKDISTWVDVVEQKHKTFRQFLGGLEKTIRVENDIVDQVGVPYNETEPLAKKIYYAINNFFTSSDIALASLCYPTYKQDERRETKWGKLLSAWMKKNKTPQEQVDIVNKAVSQLGELWAKYTNKQKEYYITFLTKPSDFIKIGHYGVDNGSCFATGNFNFIHKFMLGQTENSFVGLVSTTPNVTNSVKTRFWGIADPSYKAFYTSNFYPRIEQNSISAAIKKAFGELLDTKVNSTDQKIKVKGIYHNKDDITYYTDDFLFPSDKICIEINTEGLDQHRQCLNCRKTSHKPLEQIQQGHYCKVCAEAAWFCEFVGEKVMGARHSVIHNGRVMDVNGTIRSTKFEICSYTGNWYIKEEVGEDSLDKSIHIPHAKSLGMIECKKCNIWHKPEETECSLCSKKLNKELVTA